MLNAQYVAFIHGHRQKTWHQLDLFETLQNLNWSSIPGYTDINRIADHKYATLDHHGKLPLTPVATGSDVYNGSFSTFQVGIGWQGSEHLYNALCVSCALMDFA